MSASSSAACVADETQQAPAADILLRVALAIDGGQQIVEPVWIVGHMF